MIEKLPRSDVIDVISISTGTSLGYSGKHMVPWTFIMISNMIYSYARRDVTLKRVEILYVYG